MTKRVGILGGTFNPPHFGHLFIAEQVFEAYQLDEIRFLPNAIPPHKAVVEGITDEARIALVKGAIANNPHFTIDTREITRGGSSYTYDTMLEMKRLESDVQFYFIIGADMVEYLPKWYNINKLMELVTFIGVTRKGYRLHSDYPIETLGLPLLDLSSSAIRAQLKAGRSVRYMVPENVYYVIKESQFYES